MRRLWRMLVVFAALWAAGLMAFVHAMPKPSGAPIPHADAIVVLTGGSGRVEAALVLLAKAKAPVMFISGVFTDVTREEVIALAPGTARSVLRTLPDGAIQLGRTARSTLENVNETKLWLENSPQHRVLLVTADYHMPRALALFSAAMPEREWVPTPVFPEDFVRERWWEDARSRELVLSEYHKWLAQVPLAWIMLL